MMKKQYTLLTAAALLAAGMSLGCSEKAAADDKLQIITTIFPLYDWTVNILGENAENADLTMLLDSGVDLHSYQPTAADILKISTCDLFIYVGGESDEWVEDALQEAVNDEMIVISLMDVLGEYAKVEETVEGMQEDPYSDEDGEEEEYDEHVWLSLKNASLFVSSISEAIRTIDPDSADVYESNAAAYTEKLGALDEEYKKAVSEASVTTLLFGDRFPFRYLTDDYGLAYYAAFSGCSAETEASFETILFLSQKVDELGLHSVMTIEGTDHRIAETIIQSTKERDQQILALNSMQSTTAKDVQNGASYLSIMESNLAVLQEALK